ncbi:MAG: DMT family transporter [Pseudomonadota bacterium]
MNTSSDVQNRFALGALCMCVAMLGGTSIDIAVKALAPHYSTAQIVLLRSLFAIPLIFALVWHQVGLPALGRAGLAWQIWRGLLTAGANFGFFYGLIYVELVTALMLAYVGPVLIVLLAKPLLGEQISMARMVGVLIGFAGVLFVIQPGSVDVHPGILAILGSALCWALLSISNRQLATRVSTPVLTFYTYPISLLLAAVFTYAEWGGAWQTPVGWHWALFATAGAGSLIAHGFAALAYRYAAAGAVAPFEYTALIWISLAGYVFWNEIPAWTVWVGGAAVILGGYIALRSRS